MATKYHVRSISFPSRSHPSVLRIEEELNKLKNLDSSSSTDSLCIGLAGLEELFNCVDDLLNMSSTKQVLSQNQHEKCFGELLDGSVKLLDTCSIARDIALQCKEHVQALQSAFRRRKNGSSVDTSIANYTCFRKKMKKDAKRLVSSLKQMENKLWASPILGLNENVSVVIRVLRDVNMINISMFQSLLQLLSATVSKPKQSRWALVSKLIHKGAIASEENGNELEIVDLMLCKYGLGKLFDANQMQIAHKEMEGLEISIEGLEKGLDSMFRRLIKTRTSFLNIISQ